MIALRLMVFDETCRSYGFGLSTVWNRGGGLYRRLDRVDATYGARSWSDALDWIGNYRTDSPIAEIQYWGHGKWGNARLGKERFDAATLAPDHALAGAVDRIRDRLLPAHRSLVWFRTCETFGADAGIDFATRLAQRLGARVAGHTYIIGALQSGLRTLEPGRTPTWNALEGLREGTAQKPLRAWESSLLAKRTIHFMTNEIPPRWFAEDSR